MFSDFLKKNIKSQASYPEVGYGQVEPNHLSAQYTGQIYAQLPADPSIDILENGQFVKYDYAANKNGVGFVNFTGKGEWMLVYNEIKLYREGQWDCEFAMLKDNYQARVYSPLDGTVMQEMYGPTRFLQGVREEYDNATGTFKTIGNVGVGADGKPVSPDGITENAADFSFASKVHDYYEMDDINAPGLDEVSKRLFMKLRDYNEVMMPAGATMVPRVFKTNVGDIYTTNMINATELNVGDVLTPGAKGILEVGEGDMQWQVVKVYTMPDHQRGVKIMRIA
jgi:hypothetical protein